jgi:pimeloyl-ACP methyl ester carboxylesterase
VSALSAPSVWQPLYDCAPLVVVSGYVPGASVDIYAVPPGGAPAHIGGGVSNSASGQVFGVDATRMVAGATVYATQTYGGATSPPSPSVTVYAPLGVDPPLLHPPLYDCAECLEVDGLLPGSTAEVRAGAMLLGQDASYGGTAEVGVSPRLSAGQSVVARQLHCGTPSNPSQPVPVVSLYKQLEGRLAPPTLEGPVYACQQYVVADGCTPGSTVSLLSGATPLTRACSGGTSLALWAPGGGFNDGDSLTAVQSLCGTPGQPSAAVVVKPAADIPRPALRGPLYDGDTGLTLAMTVAGETVTIDAGGQQVGMGGAGGGDSWLNVDPPLLAGQTVTATVALCGVSKESLPVIVGSRPAVVPAPKVQPPLLACTSQVPVTGCLPNSLVRVFGRAGGPPVLLGAGRTFAGGLEVGVVGLLQVGWKVFATQEVGGVVSMPSGAVPVKRGPSPGTPKIVGPLYPCARCVEVAGVEPAARVDVYQNGVWIGAAAAGGTRAEVGVYPGLTAGATVTATQSLCGHTSKPASEKVAKQDPRLPAPVLAPAFAGDSYVSASGLVRGATVEVEELSVYKLVIGRACADGGTASVWMAAPLFPGAVLTARQRLCTSSESSPEVVVAEPRAWPLGPGPYHAGFRQVSDVPISGQVQFISSDVNGYVFQRPPKNSAMIFYPATADGSGTPFAAGGPFHLLVYGHAKRFPQVVNPGEAPCPGAPADTTQDYTRVSGILSQLARWGFVTIAPDLSWLADDSETDWTLVVQDAITYMLAANGQSGSPFHGQLSTAALGAIGHSTGGYVASKLATQPASPVSALALIAPASGSYSLSFLSVLSPRPLLVFEGGEDVGPFGRSGDFYSAAGPPKSLVNIPGANHFGYYDDVCIVADNTATISQADQQRIAKAYLVAFFRRHLLGATEEDDYLTGVRPIEQLEGFGITVQHM